MADPSRSKASHADRTEIVPQAPADRTEVVRQALADGTEILRPAGPTLLTDRAAPPGAGPKTERVFAPPSPSTLVLGDPRPGPLPRPTPAQPVSINKMLIWINLACFAAILLLILFFGLFS